MKDGFIRVAAATPDIKVADCDYNADRIIELIKHAADNSASVVVFPELCITGYTCGDLFLQKTLLDGAWSALDKIIDQTASCNLISVVGLPLEVGGKLYNCAAVINCGLIGIVPKKNIPSYSEFYETRHFTPWQEEGNKYFTFNFTNECYSVNFGDMIFSCDDIPELKIGVEICEDLWVPEPPSVKLAAMGATLICNLSASDEIIGKGDYRRQLVQSQSARLLCGYVYADAGMGESTQDLIFSGHNLIAENGVILSESKKFTAGITYGEIDLHRITHERRRMNTFLSDINENEEFAYHEILFVKPKNITLERKFPPMPFVPSDKSDLNNRCEEILTMQATGLATRLRHIGCKTAVIGLSGGLDSTLALIVAVHAFDMLGLDRKGIIAVTMPCFGTTKRTKSNALCLAEAYGTTLKEIDITKAVRQHFEDIGQSEDVLDVTYENGQARERTQVLMDIANQTGGIVIGTGDLSELALGWATYNGDHMSMYGVNASVPKTLVRHLVSYESTHTEDKSLASVLEDILATPVSPELLPPSEGEISQKTEDIVGPYELHDFFLYYFVRCGFPPKKILRIAEKSFAGSYERAEIKKWLTVFIKRFFSQQFKRSCLPDGPKVGSVTLSPRGDWRMPSDACVRLWLEDLERSQ